jgi:Fe-S cluster biogenesis protein NfuA
MTHMPDGCGLQGQLAHLEALVQGLDELGDPAAQAHVREIIQVLLELHGLGLERILSHVAEAGTAGQAILEVCARDDAVSGLLLLHGLHPHDLQTRVRQALDAVRPALRAHGGNVELLGVSEGAVRLRLLGSCDGCPSSGVTMKQTIEEAILGRAPEVVVIEVEEAAVAPAPANGSLRVALPLV